MLAAELEGQGRVRQCCIYVCMVLVFLLRDVVSLSHQRENFTKTARHVLRHLSHGLHYVPLILSIAQMYFEVIAADADFAHTTAQLRHPTPLRSGT